MKKTILIIICVVAALLVVATYFSYDPMVARFFPRCVFKTVTGYDCPGCGTQRALHALLHGNIVEAWHFNRALIVSIPLIITYTYAELNRTTKVKFYNTVNSQWMIALVFTAIMLWWILRNVFGV